MNTILTLLSFVGSLGLFLYGMKIMSEGLEKLAGDRLRGILAAMTTNRFAGVLTGAGVTALIQSSSATTVMVVSFVNAGLMTLRQAISVIMGANIGTTITAWIIALIGFKVNISALSLPLLAVSLPLIFSKKEGRKNLGEFVFGFAFLFMGLNMLSTSAEALHIDTLIGNMLAVIPLGAWWTVPLFVVIGAVLTMLMQSSSASMAVTLMLFDMNIPGFGLAQAVALAMGQNIGTTITAFLAAMTANTQAKRAALAHMFFNVFGVVVILCVFQPSIRFVHWLVVDALGAEGTPMYMLSAFHTLFNILNTLLLIGFVPQIEAFVCKVLPQKVAEKKHHLQYISAGMLSTSELSLLQAQKEIQSFAERCGRMVDMVEQLLDEQGEEAFVQIYSRIEKYEQITDRMEVEIADYLRQVSAGRLSEDSKRQLLQMLRQVDELESIGDACYNQARILRSYRDHSEEHFLPEQRSRMHEMLRLDKQAMQYMMEVMAVAEGEHKGELLLRSANVEREINNLRNDLKNKNLQDVDTGVYSYQLGVYYCDFVNEAEHLADYVINVVEA